MSPMKRGKCRKATKGGRPCLRWWRRSRRMSPRKGGYFAEFILRIISSPQVLPFQGILRQCLRMTYFLTVIMSVAPSAGPPLFVAPLAMTGYLCLPYRGRWRRSRRKRSKKTIYYKPNFCKSRVQDLYRRVAPLSPTGKAFFNETKKPKCKIFSCVSALIVFQICS